MEKKKQENKQVNKTKEEKIETKAFNKVDSKAKKEDLFSDIDDKNKKTKKEKNETKNTVKGTVTIDKKIEEKSKEKKSSSGKWIGISVALIFIIAIVIGIVFFIRTPYFAVTRAFNAMKKCDVATISKYIDYDSLVDSVSGNMEVKGEMSEFEKNCFSDLSFKINTVKVEGDTAVINIDTTNKNFRNAITKWTQSIYQKFISGEEVSNEQGINLLNECLKDSSIGTITTNKDITLTKVDGKWKINTDEQLRDAIFPGISEVINSMEALTE